MTVSTVTRAYTGNEYYIQALLGSETWHNNYGSPVSIGYTFDHYVYGNASMNAEQRAGAVSAMQAWGQVANINFYEAPAQSAVLRFSMDSNMTSAGLATLPNIDGILTDAEVRIRANATGFTPGGAGYSTLLHEIGHAIGLKHSGNNISIDFGPFLPVEEDSRLTTVMSYNYEGVYGYPRTPMIYDIAAIQFRYGANHSFNSGDNTYELTDNGYDYRTFWDGGGWDGLSAAALTINTLIDLREGIYNYSNVGDSYYWNAFGANIEDAQGGSGADVIFGNALGNNLSGGAGTDNIDGGEGGDNLYGNMGDDTLAGNTGADSLYGGKENDLIYGNQDGDRMEGNFGNDSMHGGQGADTLYGGQGNDLMYGNLANDSLQGNLGDDTLYGSQGEDTLQGGGGADVFVFATLAGADLIVDFDLAGGDVIRILTGMGGITSAAGALGRLSNLEGGGGSVLDLGDGHRVTIANIAAEQFTAEDFAVF